MVKAIIGYTGFVGNNLSQQTKFDYYFNSSNIENIFGKTYDLLVVAAPYAVKWLANQQPEKDLKNVNNLINILKQVKAEQIIQISTVDVYQTPILVNEDTKITIRELSPYGRHRFLLEEFIKNNFEDHLIVRLPALFGLGLKKNLIYDLIHPIPETIKADQFSRLVRKIKAKTELVLLKTNYLPTEDGSFSLSKDLNSDKNKSLEKIFNKLNLSSLVFTNKNSSFQFYYLDNLWEDVQVAKESGLSLINFATEPIKANKLAKKVFKTDLDYTIKPLVSYNVKTKYAEIYNGSNGYIYDHKQIYQQLNNYLKSIKYEISDF